MRFHRSSHEKQTTTVRALKGVIEMIVSVFSLHDDVLSGRNTYRYPLSTCNYVFNPARQKKMLTLKVPLSFNFIFDRRQAADRPQTYRRQQAKGSRQTQTDSRQSQTTTIILAQATADRPAAAQPTAQQQHHTTTTSNTNIIVSSAVSTSSANLRRRNHNEGL